MILACRFVFQSNAQDDDGMPICLSVAHKHHGHYGLSNSQHDEGMPMCQSNTQDDDGIIGMPADVSV